MSEGEWFTLDMIDRAVALAKTLEPKLHPEECPHCGAKFYRAYVYPSMVEVVPDEFLRCPGCGKEDV